MIIMDGRNVNELWDGAKRLIHEIGERQDSRNGPVLVAPHPVVSVYARPQERVLMDPSRDANPFFHLMESLWMLAGRDDAAFLNRYVGDFGKRFAEDGLYIHGAYGKRWRDALGYDQLNVVVEKLRRNPDDRQCVIQMWDAHGENHSFGAGCNDLHGDWRDRPCNTHIYLRVRTDLVPSAAPLRSMDRVQVLDLTVLCRSNDIVWGAYGANAVHFSVLQEYLAGRIGVGVGTMYQFSNNWHGYVDVLSKFSPQTQQPGETWSDPYAVAGLTAMPMGTDWERWDEDLLAFMEWHDGTLWYADHGHERPLSEDFAYANPWFGQVAERVAVANCLWKQGARAAAETVAENIAAADWRQACVEWMQRRMK